MQRMHFDVRKSQMSRVNFRQLVAGKPTESDICLTEYCTEYRMACEFRETDERMIKEKRFTYVRVNVGKTIRETRG